MIEQSSVGCKLMLTKNIFRNKKQEKLDFYVDLQALKKGLD